jgi:gliding motility-associated lipoprotein GldD
MKTTPRTSFYFFRFVFFFSVLVLLGAACSSEYTPKPRGYFRIALPEKKYTLLDSVLPYSFEYPTYARITNDPHSPQETTWINLEMPVFKGRIHISYKPLSDSKSLNQYAEDSRTLAYKHIAKASAIDQIAINDPTRKVYGLVYEIKGMGAASPYQFYLTDSVKNFIRGSLYFDVSPNNDSLAPVITFVQKDIQRIIETLKWK